MYFTFKIGSTYGYNNGDPIVQYRTNEGIFDLKGKDIDKNLWKSKIIPQIVVIKYEQF